MDNYFTLTNIVEMLRESVMGVVGTARFSPG